MAVPHRAAVVGSPISHSLSPVLHRAAYRAYELDDWTYEAIDCTEDKFPALVASLAADYRGLSITMPLKAIAARLADQPSDTVRRLGVANTLLFADGRILAENTDLAGIRASLDRIGRHAGATSGPVVVVGAGNTARSVCAVLAEREAEVTIVARNREKALEAARVAGLEAAIADWSELARNVATAALVVTTTPSGTPMELDSFPASATLFDVSYGEPGPLRLAAQAAGAPVLDGLLMLIVQAARQFELMTRRPAPIAAMANAVDLDLGDWEDYGG